MTEHVYAISLDGPLARDNTLPEEQQCAQGAWLCLTVLNSRPKHPSEPTRILQVIPVAGDLHLDPKYSEITATSRIDSTNDTLHPTLLLNLHGGQYTSHRQKAVFHFHCDHGSKDWTLPIFMWEFNGTHSFSWTSKKACPSRTHHTHDDAGSGEAEEGEKPPLDPEDDAQDNIKSPTESALGWGKVLPIITLTIVVIYISFRRLLHHRKLRQFQFRFQPKQILSSFTHKRRGIHTLYSYPSHSASDVLFEHWTSDAQEVVSSPDEPDMIPMSSTSPSRSKFDAALFELSRQEGSEGEEIPLAPTPRSGMFGFRSSGGGYGNGYGSVGSG